MSDADPTLGRVIALAIESAMARVRVSLPGRVLAYDDATRRARVQVEVQDVREDENGNRVLVNHAPISDVPVIFPGAGGRRIKFPVRAGDFVWLMFASSPLDRWKIRGGSVDPKAKRRHHLRDAVAIPGIDPSGVDGDADPAMIEFTEDGRILVGGNDEVVLRSEFLHHGHPIVATGATSPCAGPVEQFIADGSAATFPGTQVLKGG